MKKYKATYSMVGTWVAEFEAEDPEQAAYIIQTEDWTVEDEPDRWGKFKIEEIEDLETGVKYKVNIRKLTDKVKEK